MNSPGEEGRGSELQAGLRLNVQSVERKAEAKPFGFSFVLVIRKFKNPVLFLIFIYYERQTSL